MMGKALDLKYAELMRAHPFGTALYLPIPSSQFQPGFIGYFDATGAWNPIGDLTSSSSLPSGLSSIDDTTLKQAPSQKQIWGPKLGKATRGKAIDLTLGLGAIPMLAAAALPFDVSACFRFQADTNHGAVLLTSGPVVHERYYHKEPLLQWMKQNAKGIVKSHPEVRENGLWIITSTWTAENASVNCWNSKDKSVDVGFSTTALEFGEVAPKGGYLHGGSAEGWISTQSDEAQNEKGHVVFFHGIRFTWVPIRGLTERKTPRKFRGEGLTSSASLAIFEDDPDIGTFEVRYEDQTEKEEQDALHEDDDEEDAWE
ncbi:uncharacterized protein FSUBG_6040 [Fusarium subglutinans]|uniref:Uncharacterized protein n=1 Tax=Gibberella subglutinans TaxID=42677 RepID=A0A8H5Q0I5_GIBSU|nr:uncharacterized protein FSUBG_6040 [Fusarium subglutinans]KAF5606432.1 hypothetical protein FSUBG_6040 [Fusarium subglutinans]